MLGSNFKFAFRSTARKIPAFTALAALLMISIFVFPAFSDNHQKVALVMKALSNPFFLKMESGAKKYADKNGVKLEVYGVERETDVDQQIGIVENLVNQGYGAIVIAPADSRALLPVCKKALDRGIPVINIDNPFNKQALKNMGVNIPFIGPDNRAGAALVGKFVAGMLKKNDGFLLIEGIAGVENADQRKQGFLDAMTANNKTRLLASKSANWHKDEAFTVAVGLLKAHPEAKAILCANDNMALGALQALDTLDITGKVVVAGYDNIEEVRDEMRAGRLAATAEQHPEIMGAKGVELAQKAILGEAVPDSVVIPVDLLTYNTFGKEVAFCISQLNDPFFDALNVGMKNAAQLHGISLITHNAKNDNAVQLAHIIEILNSKPEVLILNPTDTDTIVAGIELANERNVPVLTVDRKAGGGSIICHIESDNREGGRLAAEMISGLLGGKGRVVELEGIPGTSATQERAAGFNSGLKNYPEIKVIARETANFKRSDARHAVSELIREKVGFEGIFAHNDNMILGALDALEDAGVDPLPVLVGFDGIPEARNSIRKGKLAGTIAQNPEAMGAEVVLRLVRHLRGQAVEKRIKVDLEPITR